MADFFGAALMQAVDLASASTLQAPPPPHPSQSPLVEVIAWRDSLINLKLAEAGNLLKQVSGSHRARWRELKCSCSRCPQAATEAVPADPYSVFRSLQTCTV